MTISSTFSEKMPLFTSANQINYPNEVDQLRTRSLDLTGKHTGESPTTSVSSLGSDLVCSDLPAYILFWNNCLEMQTRNSNSRSIRKADALALQQSIEPSLGHFTADLYTQSIVRTTLAYIEHTQDHEGDQLLFIQANLRLAASLPDLEAVFNDLPEPKGGES